MIVRTEAIVLRSMEYSESSRIATLLTRQMGKVSVVAKGARRTNSRFGSTLQPMSYTQVVFYHKPSRSLQTLSESSHVLRWRELGRNLERISVGLRVVELASAVVHEMQELPSVFNLTLQVLRAIDGHNIPARSLSAYYQLRLAAALGFAPDIDRDTVRSLPEDGGYFSLESGAVTAARTDSVVSLRGSRRALRALGVIALTDLETILRMKVDATTATEVDRLVEDFLKYHIQDAYPVRARKVLDRLVETD